MTYTVGENEIIRLLTELDWTSATAKQVTVFQPDGTHIHHIGNAVVVLDAPTGVVCIEFTPTMEGEHLIQAYRALSSDDKRHSPFQDFYVTESIS
jgi:hypothetical protein